MGLVRVLTRGGLLSSKKPSLYWNLSRCFSEKRNFDYDLVVIGGGSGGLACSKEAAHYGKRVAVLDFVDPSYQGTTWGLGGTCVNVGCIPKKLMHQGALLGESIKDAKQYGWDTPENPSHEWSVLTDAVQNYIRSLNWGHRVQLKTKSVQYFNGKGTFLDRNTIKATMRNGKEQIITAENVVVAVGGRPRFPDIPGAKEHCISSDDLFWLQTPPGRTLFVGASYVSLECAGFLNGLGYDTSVMVRSILLRGFDQQMANLIGDHMQEHGIKFIQNSIPKQVEKLKDGRLEVIYDSYEWGEQHSDIYDTVVMAVGRDPVTTGMGLQEIGVQLDGHGYVICGDDDQTNIPGIFAIGDVIQDRPELTPVAIMAGKLLARRLFDDSNELMDYKKVATTVFTPLEYGTVGLSEEAADDVYGHDNIEVYHAFYKPLEYSIPQRDASQCYIKVICRYDGDQEILGMHFLGPNAGEITQGFAVALKVGITYKQLASTVGIHPTSAEEVVKLHISKRSGLDPHVTGC